MKEAQSAIDAGILKPFQCQINKGIKASSAYHSLKLEDSKNLVDDHKSTGFATSQYPVVSDPAWFRIDLGPNPCYITQIQITGWNPTKTGNIKVNEICFLIWVQHFTLIVGDGF